MSPLVSILIPCFNAARWLAETLESALAQSWPRKEIVLVDDGSSDDSIAIARSFESRGLKVAVQPNAGASAARNRALSLARGDLFQFLDADDLLTVDKIAAQVELLSSSGQDCVATCRWARFSEDPAGACFVSSPAFCDLSPMDYLVQHAGSGVMMHPAAWLVPRSIAELAGPWNESLSLNDDGEYFARVALASRRLLFAKDGASLYRSNFLGSLSHRRDRGALESLAKAVELVAGHMQRQDDSPEVRRALADYWQRLEYEVYPEAPDICRLASERVRELGGSTLLPEVGSRQRRVGSLVGWKFARRLQRLLVR